MSAESLADTFLDPHRGFVYQDVLSVVADFVRGDVWERPYRPNKGLDGVAVHSAFETESVYGGQLPENSLMIDNRRSRHHNTMHVVVGPRSCSCEICDWAHAWGRKIQIDDQNEVSCFHRYSPCPLNNRTAGCFFEWLKSGNKWMVDRTLDYLQPAAFLADLRALWQRCKETGLDRHSDVYDAMEEFARKWHRIIFAPLYNLSSCRY